MDDWARVMRRRTGALEKCRRRLTSVGGVGAARALGLGQRRRRTAWAGRKKMDERLRRGVGLGVSLYDIIIIIIAIYVLKWLKITILSDVKIPINNG